MEANIPYSYLQKVGENAYILSVLATPPSNNMFLINNVRPLPNDTVRQVNFTESEGLGHAILDWYPHTSVQIQSTQVVINTLIGIAPWKLNICKLSIADQKTTIVPQPANKTFLPHLYFIVIKATGLFKIYIAVPNRSGHTYSQPVVGEVMGKKRRVEIREVESAGMAAGIWTPSNLPTFDQDGADIVTVEVFDKDGNPKGSGTIRHGIADNKPFGQDEDEILELDDL